MDGGSEIITALGTDAPDHHLSSTVTVSISILIPEVVVPYTPMWQSWSPFSNWKLLFHTLQCDSLYLHSHSGSCCSILSTLLASESTSHSRWGAPSRSLAPIHRIVVIILEGSEKTEPRIWKQAASTPVTWPIVNKGLKLNILIEVSAVQQASDV